MITIQPIHELPLALDLVSVVRYGNSVRGTIPTPLEAIREDFPSGYVRLKWTTLQTIWIVYMLLDKFNAVRQQSVGGNGELYHTGWLVDNSVSS